MVHLTNWIVNALPERFPRLKTIWIEAGLAWLRFLHKGQLGGVFADDMGLGKTVQLLAFFDGLRSSGRLPATITSLPVSDSA